MRMMNNFSLIKKMIQLNNQDLILQPFYRNFSKIQYKNSVLALKDPNLKNE